MANSLELAHTNKLLKELFDTGAFHCDVCNKLMIPTAWLSSDKRNFCSTCCEHEKITNPSVVFIENPALNKLLRKLTLPCENHQKGCKKLLEYSAYEDHTRTCPYASTTCLHPACKWNGALTNLQKHFLTEHTEMVPIEQDRTFMIPCEKGDFEKIYCLQTVKGCIFLAIQCVDICCNLRLLRHRMLQDVKASFYCQLSPSPGKMVQHKCEIADLHESDETSGVTEINIDAMPGKFPMEIVYNFADNYTLVPVSILSCYLCWDCKGYIKTDVLECPDDHPVCKDCLDTTGHRCANGTHYITGSQSVRPNRALNKLAKKYLLPCRYQRFGCRYHVPLENNHEPTCCHKHVRCPLKGQCSEFFKEGNFLMHLRAAHGSLDMFKGDQSIMYTAGRCTANNSIIVADGEVFSVSCTGECMYGGFPPVRYIEWIVEKLTGKADEQWTFTVSLRTRPFKKAFSVTGLCGETIQLKTSEFPECPPSGRFECHVEVTRLSESLKTEVTW